jgi:tetratricopeptide (TPR) repeat protein
MASWIIEVRMTLLRKTALTLAALAAVSCSASALTPSRGGAAAVEGPAPREAQAKAKKAKIPANEKNAQDEYEKGAIALRYGLTDEAIRYGERALAFFPGSFNALALLGSAYYTKGEYARSAEAYEKAAALKPDSAELQRNLGLAYIELKESEKAFAALKKAFTANGDAEAAYYLGRLCYAEKRFDEALDYAVKAVQKDGKSARAYNLKGVILNQLGRFPEAAGSFQAGLVLAPEDVGIQINLGIAYINTKEPAKAKAVLEAVLPKIEDAALKSRVEGYIKAIKDAGK